MRAKFINEKFTEDSDPIEDMGIGMTPPARDLQRIKDIKTKAAGNQYRERTLANSMAALIKNPEKAFNRYLAARLIGGEHWYVTKLFLIRALDLGYPRAKYRYAELEKEFYLYNKLSEKFVEDSDPIKDMGIGKFYNLKRGDIIARKGQGTKEYGNDILSSRAKGIVLSVTPVQSKIQIEAVFFTTIDSGTMNYVLNNGASTYGISNITLTPKEWEKDFSITLNKDAETLYEKFSQNSDPIHDMGIGSPFYSLERGDIIMREGESKRYGLSYLGSYSKGIVLSVKPFQSKIQIEAVFFHYITPHIMHEVLKGAAGLVITNITLTPKEWEEDFSITLNKDAKTLYEKFSQDSDPIQDMGIGKLRPNRDFNTVDDLAKELYSIIHIIIDPNNEFDWSTDKKTLENLEKYDVRTITTEILTFKENYKWTVSGKHYGGWIVSFRKFCESKNSNLQKYWSSYF